MIWLLLAFFTDLESVHRNINLFVQPNTVSFCYTFVSISLTFASPSSVFCVYFVMVIFYPFYASTGICYGISVCVSVCKQCKVKSICIVHRRQYKPLIRLRDHLSCGMPQCYLPPSRDDSPDFTLEFTSTHFTVPQKVEGWVDLGTAVKVHNPCPRLCTAVVVVTNTRPRCASILVPNTPHSSVLPLDRCNVMLPAVLCFKMAKHFIKILSPPDSFIILVFHHWGLLLNSDSFTPNEGAKYKGWENWVIFDQ